MPSELVGMECNKNDGMTNGAVPSELEIKECYVFEKYSENEKGQKHHQKLAQNIVKIAQNNEKTDIWTRGAVPSELEKIRDGLTGSDRSTENRRGVSLESEFPRKNGQIMKARNTLMRGRQMVSTVLEFYNTNRNQHQAYSYEDMEGVQWLGDEH